MGPGNLSFGVQRWMVLLTLAGGYFIALLDLTIINLAVPELTRSLGTTTTQLFWAVNGYGLLLAVCILLSGRFGDRFGHRRLFLLGMSIVALGSLVCAASRSPEELIAGRLLQGVGAGMLVPQTLTLIGLTFPEEIRGRVIGLWGSLAGTASVLGPLVGGSIIDSLGWRWVFLVNLPIAAVVLWLGLRSLPAGEKQAVRFDLPGALLAGVGLTALLFGALHGPDSDWGWGTLIAGCIAVGCLAAFFVVESRVDPDRALYPWTLRRNTRFSVASLSGLVTTVGVFSLTFVVVNYVQSLAGQSAFVAGAVLVPASIASVIVAPIAGKWVDEGRGRRVLQVGFGASALGAGLCAAIAMTGIPWGWFSVGAAVFGLGNGAVLGPLTTFGMAGLPRHLFGAASSIMNVLRQTGPVLAGALIGALVQLSSTSVTAVNPLGFNGEVAAGIVALAGFFFACGWALITWAPQLFLGAAQPVLSTRSTPAG